MRLVEEWPVENAATAVVSATGEVLGTHGDPHRVYRLASVTKLITAYAALIAVEEGVAELDDPAGPAGSTIRHLLAHASGLNLNDHNTVARVGAKRVYSSAGFEQLADALAERSGIPFADYVRDGLLGPLGMTATTFEGSPGHGASSTVADLTRFAAEVQQPTLLDASTVEAATTVAFSGLTGILPGYGRQDPNDWGLGFEIRDGKDPHWTGARNSPRTYGHFGQSGTFVWVDPDLGAACIALTDRDFGEWAIDAWPPYCDAVVDELGAR